MYRADERYDREQLWTQHHWFHDAGRVGTTTSSASRIIGGLVKLYDKEAEASRAVVVSKEYEGRGKGI